MKIRTVTVGRTKNIGNYNSVKVECTVELDDDESPDDAANHAKNFVMQHCGDLATKLDEQKPGDRKPTSRETPPEDRPSIPKRKIGQPQ